MEQKCSYDTVSSLSVSITRRVKNRYYREKKKSFMLINVYIIDYAIMQKVGNKGRNRPDVCLARETDIDSL